MHHVRSPFVTRFARGALGALLLSGAACAPAPESRAAVPSSGAAAQPSALPRAVADSAFARLVERLSEPAGFFDTDNLISNESSYLHVLGAMRRLGVTGGAYIGVGPDQNFSYIARIRPRVAFIIDIRRDNLVQHLMYRALFEMARTRVEYLALLHGRPVPRDVARWRDRPLADIVAYIDSTPATERAAAVARAGIVERVRRTGVPLSEREWETLARFHGEFVRRGLDLRFTSFNRGPRPYYPTYRQLLMAHDREGGEGSYLAREEDFRFLKEMETRGLVVPVVGDLAGDHALAAIGDEIAARGLTVSAFYTSNVEFYLVREGSFDRFAATTAALPRNARSVMIRSYFGGTFGASHPHAVPGFFSTQTLQTLDSFARSSKAGQLASYWDVVTRDAIEP
jgi:hypothetical protein